MSESQNNLMPFAKIFEIAAIHIFGDPSLIDFIPDKKNAITTPDNLRKSSQDARIQLSLLHSKHSELMTFLASEIDVETRNSLEKKRDDLQEAIHATLKNWLPEALLRDYADKFEKHRRAEIVAETLLNACAEGKMTLWLNSEIKLPPNILLSKSGARFLPKESILECEIDGEIRSGIVFGDETEVREWLIGEDIDAGNFNTPEKRKRKCAALYEARLVDPVTCNCSKEEHFNAIKAVIPGLLKEEFESVRRALGSKFPGIRKGGRRPKPRPEA